MYRTLVGILAVFAATLLVASLTFRASVDEAADFRFANGSEPKTLDPHLATGEPEGRLLLELFEGLTRLDAKTLKPVPGVAESWEISEDGLRYVFKLRNDARWTDGKPLTAHDFAFAFRRLLTPELGADYAYILSPVRLAIELNSFDALADSVRKTIVPGLDKLSREHPQGVAAPNFQKFLSDVHAHEALQHAGATALQPLLQRREGTVSAAELEALQRELLRLERTLREGAAYARAHFGVDEGAYATGDKTFVVELRAPTPYFLELTSFYPALPVPRHVLAGKRNYDAWFLPERIVSNGPYRLAKWEVNARIRLERNELYWDKARVRMRVIDALSSDNATTALNLYLTGAIDWLPKLYPKDLVDIVKKHPDFYSGPSLSVYYYRLNTTRKPLNDRRVRQALSLAIDRRIIVRDVLGLGQQPTSTFVPPGIPGYEPPENAIEPDVPRARELLAQAGFPGGAGFPKLGILYNTNEDHKKIAEVIGDQLRRNLNIEVAPYNQEWQSYLETTRLFDYDIARGGWVGDYSDPNTFLDMWVTNGPNNQTGFSSPQFDRLIRLAADITPLLEDPERFLPQLKRPDDVRRWLEPARTGPVPDRLAAREKMRMAIFREAETILVEEELPIIPIYFSVNSGFVRRQVRGFNVQTELPSGEKVINFKDMHPLSEVWLETERSVE